MADEYSYTGSYIKMVFKKGDELVWKFGFVWACDFRSHPKKYLVEWKEDTIDYTIGALHSSSDCQVLSPDEPTQDAIAFMKKMPRPKLNKGNYTSRMFLFILTCMFNSCVSERQTSVECVGGVGNWNRDLGAEFVGHQLFYKNNYALVLAFLAARKLFLTFWYSTGKYVLTPIECEGIDMKYLDSDYRIPGLSKKKMNLNVLDSSTKSKEPVSLTPMLTPAKVHSSENKGTSEHKQKKRKHMHKHKHYKGESRPGLYYVSLFCENIICVVFADYEYVPPKNKEEEVQMEVEEEEDDESLSIEQPAEEEESAEEGEDRTESVEEVGHESPARKQSPYKIPKKKEVICLDTAVEMTDEEFNKLAALRNINKKKKELTAMLETNISTQRKKVDEANQLHKTHVENKKRQHREELEQMETFHQKFVEELEEKWKTESRELVENANIELNVFADKTMKELKIEDGLDVPILEIDF